LVALCIGTFAVAWPQWSAAAPRCESDSKQAVEQARKAIATSDPADDRAALLCLAETVAALDAKLEGLRNGSVPFTGTAHTNIVVLRKAPAREGR
jgi:hypothetical protein